MKKSKLDFGTLQSTPLNRHFKQVCFLNSKSENELERLLLENVLYEVTTIG